VSEGRRHSGISVPTLLVAAGASAVAAFVVPLFWEPGTVFAAAMTPIIVAVTSEAIRRPTEKVAEIYKPTAPKPKKRVQEEPFDPLAPPPAEDLQALPPTQPRRVVHGRRRLLSGKQWKYALVTGLAAFGIAGAFLTASELLAGEPVTSDGGRTTFFGGRDDNATPTPSPSPTASPTETATPAPTETATPTPTPTPTPTATETPAPVAPETQQATPTVTPAPTP
jgi:septal ring-binding cell division protein DamX